MMVTRLSAMVSFLWDATSTFPAITTFGLVAALLVLVNYCAVIVFYPAVVIVRETRWAVTPFCCGW
eukprot:gene46403-6351_t